MITLVRHCECYNSHNGVLNYMRVNPPLIQEGIERAKKLKGTYDRVIISPMSRCIETFIYSDIQGPREINSLFRELILCPGDFRQNDDPEVMAETREVFQKRVKMGMEYLKTLTGNICVVTHSEWIKEALKLDNIPDYGQSIAF